jgi:hypothetical protein
VHYVDLQADPKIDKDSPPDLKHLSEEAGSMQPPADPSSTPAAPAAAAQASAPALRQGAGGAGGKKGAKKPAAASSSSKSSGTGPRAPLNTEALIDKVRLLVAGLVGCRMVAGWVGGCWVGEWALGDYCIRIRVYTR